jgi:hypothetical protein
MVLKAHRETLDVGQRFWMSLLHKNVRFNKLTSVIQSLDKSIRETDRVYRHVYLQEVLTSPL